MITWQTHRIVWPTECLSQCIYTDLHEFQLSRSSWLLTVYSWPTEYVYSTLTINSCLASTHLSSNSFARFWLHQQHCVHSGMHSYCYCCAPWDLVRILNICINYALCHSVILAVVSSYQVSSRQDSTIKYRMTNNVLSDVTSIKFVQCVKETLRRRIAYIFFGPSWKYILSDIFL